MKNLIYLFAFGLLLFTYSCKEQISDVEADEQPIASYFLDGNAIDENTYLEVFETHQNIWMVTELDDQGNPIYINYSFTSDEKYIAWGETQDMNIKDRLEAIEYLQTQAVALGWIDKYNNLEEIPQEILDAQLEYLQDKSLVESGAQERTIVHLRDFCYQSTPHIPMFTVIPAMPGGWNNRVSAVLSTGYSLMTVFDRSFFRNPISTIFIAPAVESCWAPGVWPNPLMILHNRMSSGIAT